MSQGCACRGGRQWSIKLLPSFPAQPGPLGFTFPQPEPNRHITDTVILTPSPFSTHLDSSCCKPTALGLACWGNEILGHSGYAWWDPIPTPGKSCAQWLLFFNLTNGPWSFCYGTFPASSLSASTEEFCLSFPASDRSVRTSTLHTLVPKKALASHHRINPSPHTLGSNPLHHDKDLILSLTLIYLQLPARHTTL